MVKFTVIYPCMELARVGVNPKSVYLGTLKDGNVYFETHKYGMKYDCVVYGGNYQLIDGFTVIEIQHQETKRTHRFKVINPNNLTPDEVFQICNEMGVKALFVNQKYYDKN